MCLSWTFISMVNPSIGRTFRSRIIKTFKTILSIILAAACVFLAAHIIMKSNDNQQIKNDFAEVRHIRYGLFSINEWEKQISVIVNDEIKNIDLVNSNRAELKKLVESQLNVLIDKVAERIKNANKGSVSGAIKQSVIDNLVDMKEIKEGIPSYADEIIAEMKKSKNKKTVKKVVEKKVKEYFEKTFEEQDLEELKSILARYASPDKESARTTLAEAVARLQPEIFQIAWIFIALAAIQFALCGFGKGPLPKAQIILLTITLVALLSAGVATPMIDLEAKISEMKFTLLDHQVGFENQVLYYQTKSILNVFSIMIAHPDIQMKVVGILMVVFSLVFPVFKLFSSLIYSFDFRGARENKIIQFFVLKSGKWSMTDVLVVAIFMAYIGFNGIISSQFEKLNRSDSDLVLLTTNGTSLQPGFYLFLAYAVLALFLSGFLKRGAAKSDGSMNHN
ncbi:MAG: hypothetical protein EOP10_00595 [Proteobacteria bacterium]|nr:MAG: hypothetical protein EOP10_00595 [Pseudomonadota bacterium]